MGAAPVGHIYDLPNTRSVSDQLSTQFHLQVLFQRGKDVLRRPMRELPGRFVVFPPRDRVGRGRFEEPVGNDPKSIGLLGLEAEI